MTVAGPFGKADLADKPGFDPSAGFHLASRQAAWSTARWPLRQIRERAIVLNEVLKFRMQRCEELLIETGSNFGGKHQFFGLIISHQQRAEVGPGSFWR